MRMRKGFTLIELLVVIAIIGILATLVITQVSGAQQKARNANAKSDVTQMGKAVELYRNDDSNSTGNSISGSNTAAIDAVLAGTGSGTGANTNTGTTTIPAMFTGTLNVAGFTYGTGITKTPSTTHIYRYETNSTAAGAAATAYSIWTQVTSSDTAFCVKNGTTINGVDATSAPTGCSNPTP